MFSLDFTLGYHAACSYNEQPRQFDCICNSKFVVTKTCSFVHISTNKKFYEQRHKDPTEEELQSIAGRENELATLLGNPVVSFH